MKTLLSIFLILTIGIIFLAACTTPPPPSTTEIGVLRDITDKHSVQPNPNEIFSLYGLSQSSLTLGHTH